MGLTKFPEREGWVWEGGENVGASLLHRKNSFPPQWFYFVFDLAFQFGNAELDILPALESGGLLVVKLEMRLAVALNPSGLRGRSRSLSRSSSVCCSSSSAAILPGRASNSSLSI